MVHRNWLRKYFQILSIYHFSIVFLIVQFGNHSGRAYCPKLQSCCSFWWLSCLRYLSSSWLIACAFAWPMLLANELQFWIVLSNTTWKGMWWLFWFAQHRAQGLLLNAWGCNSLAFFRPCFIILIASISGHLMPFLGGTVKKNDIMFQGLCGQCAVGYEKLQNRDTCVCVALFNIY